MAIVKNYDYDGFSGKLGNIIFRTRYGKTVAYRVTENFKKSESEASKANRNKWKPMSQFASNICSLPELKAIWSMTPEVKATSAYHKIEKMNRKVIGANRPTIKNDIVPNGFLCESTSAKLSKDELEITADLMHNSLRDLTADNFLVIAVICFYEPVKKDDEYFTFYNIYKQIPNWKVGTPVEAIYKFSEEEGKIFSEYRKSILYYTVIGCDAEGYFLGNSISYNLEFENIAGNCSKTSLTLK